jgi:hypothetical protein
MRSAIAAGKSSVMRLVGRSERGWMISFMCHYLLNIVAISSWKRYNLSMSSVPIDTVSRGRLRIWKRAARQRYERVIQIFESDAFGKITADFTRKHGVGQRRRSLS